ncbi:hypothetical protein FZX02_03340, partial [Synechococcus sp. MU1644]|nr:hypothetical protein [Synechococcus sp. MU1644]
MEKSYIEDISAACPQAIALLQRAGDCACDQDQEAADEHEGNGAVECDPDQDESGVQAVEAEAGVDVFSSCDVDQE